MKQFYVVCFLAALLFANSVKSIETCEAGLIASSGLASIDTSDAELLNFATGGLLGLNTKLTVADTGYASLLTANISLFDYLDALAIELSVANRSDALTANLTLTQSVNAMIVVLQNQGGQVTAINTLEQIKLSFPVDTLTFSDVLLVDGDDSAVLAMSINILDLLMASIQAFNHQNAIAAENISLDLAALGLNGTYGPFGVSLNGLTVGVIAVEGPKLINATNGTAFNTSALRMRINVDLVDVTLPTVGIGPVTIDINLTDFKLYADVARANGVVTQLSYLTQVLGLDVTPGAASFYLGEISEVNFSDRGINSDIDYATEVSASPIGSLDIALGPSDETIALNIRANANANGALESLSYTGPFPNSKETTAGATVITSLINTIITNSELTFTPSPTLIDETLLATSIKSLIVDDVISPLISSIVTNVIDPLLQYVGIGIGNARQLVLGLFGDSCIPSVEPLVTSDQTPTLTGLAYHLPALTESVNVQINSETYQENVDVNFVNDRWTLTIPGSDSLADGQYEVLVTVTNTVDDLTDASNLELTIDTLAPTVAIQNAPANTNSAFTATFEFSENVTGFVIGDISLSNANASGFVAVDGNTYTALITPVADGNMTIDVNASVAVDVAGNNNTAATQVVSNFDATAPSVAIQNVPANTNSAFTATFEFSENVTGFVVGDISLGNANASGFVAVDGNTYTALITPVADGNVTIDVNAAVAVDVAGNNNTAATQVVSNFDATAPSVVIQNAPANTNSAFTATFEFSENVTGFVIGDISLANANASGFVAVDGNTYTALITPVADGNLTIDVNASVAVDVAGNNSTAATQVVSNFDATAPSVVIQNAPANTNSAFTATFEFSENVTGFVIGDISLSNANASGFVAVDGNTYTALITPIADGNLTIDVNASVAVDVAGNNNTAATQVVSNFDATAPSVVIQNVPTNTNSAFTTTFEFSENVTGFVIGDISLSNANASGFVAVDGNTYSALITPIADGNVTIDVNASVAVDVAGNNNTAAIQVTTSFDNTPPIVSIANPPIANITNMTNYVVNGTCSSGDNNVDVSILNASPAVQSILCQSGSWDTTFDVSGIANGTNVIVINASQSDSSGSVGNAPTVYADKDATEPDVQINSHDVANLNNQSNYIVGGSCTLGDGDVAVSIQNANPVTQQAVCLALGSWSASFDVSAITDGADVIQINAQQTDNANNLGAAIQVNQSKDTIAPSVTILNAPAIINQATAFTITMLFSEAVINFDVNDILQTNASLNNFSVVDATTYTVEVSPDLNGNIQVSLPAASAQDSFANASSATQIVILLDRDGDGLTDDQELLLGTSMELRDTDRDGIADGIEVGDINNPSDTDFDGVIDALEPDDDGDGIPTSVEDFNLDNDFDPSTNATDSDLDNIANYLDNDSDGDNIPDFIESGASGTDIDNDGIDDGFDVDQTGGIDANNDGIDDAIKAQDTDGDSIADYFDLDSDGDGFPDMLESGAKLVDSDLDGIDDAFDVDITGGNDANNDGRDDDVLVRDTDSDNVPDFQDLDSDNDGLADRMESNVSGNDSDNDGIDDYFDVDQTAGIDANRDGIDDAVKPLDSDADNVADYIDVDSDNDGVPDFLESLSQGIDADNDGVDDAFDVDQTLGSDLNNDGVDDAKDPRQLDSDNDGKADLFDSDSDNDGISDGIEADVLFTDGDGDGIDDVFDVNETGGVDLNQDGIDDSAMLTDSDSDGQADYIDKDSDNDGLPDALEGNVDTDQDLIADFRDVDSDNDLIGDGIEGGALGVDSDADGIDDAFDVDVTGGVDANLDGVDDAIVLPDSDQDGIPDFRDTDIDSDNDGISDLVEGNADPDNDGIPNYLDEDSDGDGILDLLEGEQDADNDGIANYLDEDSDGDGIADRIESSVDTDGDGEPDYLDLDSDNDGLPDQLEGNGDTDNDGIPDFRDEDSDGDGILDSIEGSGDTDGDGTPDYRDNSSDEDADGIPDIVEGTDDFDNDGIANFLDPDSDNDGIVDGYEAKVSGVDTDGDGIDDAYDVDITGGDDSNHDGIDDFISPIDSDGDGNADYLDIDSDQDGIPDVIESKITFKDSDGDGVLDLYDVDITLGNDADSDGIDDRFDVDFVQGLDANKDGINDLLFVYMDKDKDGLPDHLDLDSDNDRIVDGSEADISGQDLDLDGIDDKLDIDFVGGNDINLDGIVDTYVFTATDLDASIDMHDLDSDNDGTLDSREANNSSGMVWTALDTDNDGVPDFRDLDSDNDGVFDIASNPERLFDRDNDGQIDITEDADGDGIDDSVDANKNEFGTGELLDHDSDGIPSHLDWDDDNDGIADVTEQNIDTDEDGIFNSLDRDSDNDGLSDAFETDRPLPGGVDINMNGIDDAYDASITGGADADNDGVDDGLLMLDSDNDGVLDFLDTDSDNDGFDDTIEQVLVTLSGVDLDNDGIDDAVDVDFTLGADINVDGVDDALIDLSDFDQDGLLNFRDPDSDGDGINDADDGRIDSDGDGLLNFLDLDSDNDGIADSIESNVDSDSDGIPDFLDLDSDNDGILDAVEGNIDSDNDGIKDYLDLDSDNDGIPDLVEGVVDTDGDGVADFRDTDSDNDGILDANENGDFDNDGINDRLQKPRKVESTLKGSGSIPVPVLVVLAMFIGLAKRRHLGLPVLMILLSFNSIADERCEFAEDTSSRCWYIAAGFGVSDLQPDENASGWNLFDDRDSGYKLSGGYVISEHWFSELSYVDLGSARLRHNNPNLGQTLFVDYSGFSASAGYWFSDVNSVWNAYLKAGVAMIDTEANFPQFHDQQTSTQILFGGGLQWKFSQHWMTRLEVDSYDKDALYLGISIARFFGQKRNSTAPTRKKMIDALPASTTAITPPIIKPVAADQIKAVKPAPIISEIPESVDTDRDGVIDENDQCPTTSAGVEVNSAGCAILQKLTLRIQFDSGANEIKPEFQEQIESVAETLKQFKNVTIVVVGHTDWQGKQKDNQLLSERRAEQVSKALIDASGISPELFQTGGRGELEPIDSNETTIGRYNNRRVEITIERKSEND